MTLRLAKAAAIEGLDQHSPFVWTSIESDPGWIYELRPGQQTFLCFFIACDAEHAAPKLMIDRGAGFDEMTAMVFRPFPFGFYHVSLATLDSAKRLRLRPCEGKATFRMAAFESSRPVLVAVLHFLFNLRYQKIGLVAPAPRGLRGVWPMVTSNVARIVKFFADVSAGSGIRVQQADDDVLARLRLTQTHQVTPLAQEMREHLADRAASPLLSFVSPVFDTDPDVLKELVESFLGEDAAYSELILVDDGSKKSATKAALAALQGQPNIRIVRQAANGGIAVATNAGIAVARGDWVAFIDHDDAFVPGAIAMIAKAVLDHPDASFFYTDEIIANAAMKPVGSFLKPTYDSVLLSGLNYINHFSVFDRTKLRALGGLRLDREGSQDYDLLLRYLADATPGSIVHIPFLAYTWRRGETSYSALFRERSAANARTALRVAYAAAGREVTIEPAGDADAHRIRFKGDSPLVSIVIPNRDSLPLIRRIVADLRDRTDYRRIEIVIVDNGSKDPEVLAFYAAQRGEGFAADIADVPFNFSAMCNRGARLATGDALLFLNNDIEVMEPGWLGEMVECLAYRDAGIVGARLLYPNGKLQHAGVIVGLGSAAGHWHIELDADHPGPMGRLAVRQTLSAVTAACMLVTRRCFEDLGGFDETDFAIAYNDVDFCMRARQNGYRTVWTPFATLIHHESLSRGSDETGANALRFKAEMARLKARHGTETFVDEAFSPFYDRRYSKPHLIVPQTLQAPRRNSLA